MRKVNYIIFIILMFFVFNFNVMAKSYSKEFTDVATTCEGSECGIEDYVIKIRSNDLDDVVGIDAYSSSIKAYVDEDYQLFLSKIYGYNLRASYGDLTEFDGEVEILIKDEGLVEGAKYKVYYFEEKYTVNTLDKTKIGDVAEVVKVDGELYLRLVTTTLKSFGIESYVSEEYKKEFEKISKDGYYLFPAIKPQLSIEDGFDFYTFYNALSKKDLSYNVSPVEEYDPKKDYQHMILSFDNIPGETHVVKYKWKEKDVPNYMKKEIKDIEKSIKENTEASDFGESNNSVYFEIEDLNYINYLYHSDKNWGEDDTIFLYSTDIKRTFKYNNFKYYFDFRAGGGHTPFDDHAFGYMLVEKDDLLYSTVMVTVGLVIKPVIYIPDNVKDNDQAYMDAALKRVKEYLQIENVSLKVGGKRTDYEKSYDPEINEFVKTIWNKYYNEKKLSENYYILNVNGKDYEFLIEKNTKKSKDVEFITRDIDTNIEINTNGFLPMDSLVEVKHIGESHSEYKNILDILKKEFADIYDLKLYSDSNEEYITKINGVFKVKIPLKEEYKNKMLKVYYVNDKGEKEVFNVTIEGDYAVFETSHFSTYALVVDEEVQTPKTLDNISIYFLTGLAMFGGVLYTSSVYKKKFVRKYKI